MAYVQNKLEINRATVQGATTYVMFVPRRFGAPYAGITIQSGVHKNIGIACTVISAANGTLEPINEQDIIASGKEVLKVNDGTQLTGMSFTLRGNATGLISALKSQNLKDEIIIDYTGSTTTTKACDVLLVSINPEDQQVAKSILILDAAVTLTDMPGAVDTGEVTREMVISQGGGKVYELGKGKAFAYEYWYDNSINANAPDGLITSFKVGQGEGNSSVGPQTALNLSIIATGLAQKFKSLRLNGVEVDESEASWNAISRQVEFNTAPANLGMLEMWYAIDATSENLPLNIGATAVESVQHTWTMALNP